MVRIPPNLPPNPSDYGRHLTKQQMKQDIETRVRNAYGNAAPPSLMQLIDRFLHTKNWHQADQIYQQIVSKIEQGDTGDASSNSPADGPPFPM
jgi:hypothetical protein